jgi:hypothetical protein
MPILEFYKDRSQKDGRTRSCKYCNLKVTKVSRDKNSSREFIVIPEVRTCPRCKTEKPSSEFSKNKTRSDGLNSCCKVCDAKSKALSSEKNKARQHVTIPEFKTCPKCGLEKPSFDFSFAKRVKDGLKGICKKCDSVRRMMAEYGISNERYNDLLNSQNGQCAICKCTPGTDERPLCVDHSHITGEVRGLLCVGCNFLIGLAKDSIHNLYSAIEYLNKYEKSK